MKALILAAGLGTRLLPYTEKTPKPLFSLGGKPLLEHTIERLVKAGCDCIAVNTHHLADRIETFLSAKSFPVPVFVSREQVVLGAGGAMKKLENFWGTEPFLVVNGDIVSDIDCDKAYRFHREHGCAATLALTDCDLFNSVAVDENGFVRKFLSPDERRARDGKILTFTGVQVLDRRILEYIPPGTFYSSIDAYANFLEDGGKIKACIPEGVYWKDIGSPERYREAVLDTMAPEAFCRAFSKVSGYSVGKAPFPMVRLKGDGSDRAWHRIHNGERSLVVAEHGIHAGEQTGEAEAFVKIGRHLFRKGVPVPEIHCHDIFSGIVFMRDLGDANLMETVLKEADPRAVEALYKKVVEKLCLMWSRGAEGFDPSWTWQTPRYDRALILEKECRYFTDAFLKNFLNMPVSFERLAPDFFRLADRATENSYEGFMHRDFQSRNIMVKNGEVHFIDFQGGRLGPIQYDLASLLIDPYTALDDSLQNRLLEYCLDCLKQTADVSPERFLKGYRYCAVSRNLQILGAFSFLGRVKKKDWFAQFVPRAMGTLRKNLDAFFPGGEFGLLKAVVDRAGSEQ